MQSNCGQKSLLDAYKDRDAQIVTTKTAVNVDSKQVFEQLSNLSEFVSLKWVANHVRLLQLKFKGYKSLFGLEYSADDIVNQVKMRHDLEFCDGKASLLKRIAQRDDFPGLYMILFIVSIEEQDDCYLELSDGWYSLKFLCDNQLKLLVANKKIKIGQKLKLFGCELTEKSEASEILESTMILKMSFNSVKRAPWYAKLGEQKHKTFLTSLASIHHEGGVIPCIDADVVSSEPVMYLFKKKQVLSEEEVQVMNDKLCEQLLRVNNYEEVIEEHKRNLVPFLRLEIVDHLVNIKRPSPRCSLTVWNPKEDLIEVKPGSRLQIFGAHTSGKIFRDVLQISSSSHTQFKTRFT